MWRKFTLPSTQWQTGRSLVVWPQENVEWWAVSSISISRRFPQTWFAANKAAADTLRDNYYTANPSELIDNLYIITAYNNWSDNVWDLQVYFDGIWNDQMESIGGSEILNNVDNGFIPLRDTSGLVNSSLQETSTEIISTKSIQTPDGTLNIGNWWVSNAASTLVFTDNARWSTFFPIASQLTAQWQSNPVDVWLWPISITPSAADISETFTWSNIQFRIINANTGQADQYTFNSAANTTDCNITIRTWSHGNPIPSFDWKRATGWTGFNLTTWENALTLPVPVWFLQWVELFVTIEAWNGQTLSLRGQTLDVWGTNETVPYIEVNGRLWTLREYTPRLDTSNDSSHTLSAQEINRRISDNSWGASTAEEVSQSSTNQNGLISWSANVQVALDRIDATWLWASARTITGSFNAIWSPWSENTNTWFWNRQNVIIEVRPSSNGQYTFRMPDADDTRSMFDALAALGLWEEYTITLIYLGGNTGFVNRNRLTINNASVSIGFPTGTFPTVLAQGQSATFRVRRGGQWERIAFEQAVNPAPTLWEVVLQSTAWNNEDNSFLPSWLQVLQGYAFPVIGSSPNDGTLRQGLLDAWVSDRIIYDGDYVIWTAPTFTSWDNGDDWFVLPRNQLQELSRVESNFLSQITEIDNRVDIAPINVLGSEWVVWISENPLAEAPFIIPSTDPNNPRTGDDYRYIGGRENRDFTGINFQFNQNRFNSYLTVGITPSFITANNESDIFIYIRDEDRNIIETLNLATDFTLRDDATFTNSTYRHYVRNTSINYPFLATIEVVLTQVQEHFRIDRNSVDVTQNIPDQSIIEDKLSVSLQEKLNRALPPANTNFDSIEDRLSPYKTVTNTDVAHDALFLSSTATWAYPSSLSDMNSVSATNSRFTASDVVLFVAVPEPWNFVLNNITTWFPTPLGNWIPNVEVVESLSQNGVTYFIYRVTSITSWNVFEVDRVTQHQVVAWADDIRNLEDDIERIDTELEHAALNLPDDVVQILENDVTVTEENNPVITSTDYNNGLWDTGTQTVFYETNPNAPSGWVKASKPISDSTWDRARRKLVYFPEGINYTNQAYLTSFDWTTWRDLISYINWEFYVNVRVNGTAAETRVETIYPAPPNRVSWAWFWQTIPALTFQNWVPIPEADELFFTRNIPTQATTLTIQYRGHANGNIFWENTISMPNVWGDQDAFATFTLNDWSEQLDVEVRYDASAGNIRVSETARVFNWLPTINDVQVILSYSETRTIPATSGYNKNVLLEHQHEWDQVFAIKPSDNGNLIIVGNRIEIDTNRPYTTLFGASEWGHLVANEESAVFLDYEDFDPIDTTITSLENHATLPQFGLFTTNYTHETIVNLDTQLTAKNSEWDTVKLWEELVLVAPDNTRWRLSVDDAWALSTTQIT